MLWLWIKRLILPAMVHRRCKREFRTWAVEQAVKSGAKAWEVLDVAARIEAHVLDPDVYAVFAFPTGEKQAA